ncbi:DUF1804 family protein [Thermospira aquatica]|uniref:DUF1804 family protein n=1 Tax=Thermospira aquatica TaxID=2828656 RepID=A0AAX3BE40_9SPIR|nr:DUF1804 family protein [Thermospira aquatica]URA10547.1 DUF1804 family protein [Thermospira aquatica]
MNKCQYTEEARKLYVFENKTLTEISKLLGISLNTLSRWKNTFDWELDKQKYNRKVKNVLEILETKISELLEELEKTSVFDISEEDLKKLKILKETLSAIKKSEATLENYIKVMNDFVDFISQKYPERKEELARIIQDFFDYLEAK